MHEVCDKKNKAPDDTLLAKNAKAAVTNAARKNGTSNGNGRHLVSEASPVVSTMPDVQATVLAATQTAKRRRMPLHSPLVVGAPEPLNMSAALSTEENGTLRIQNFLNGSARRIDIAHSLAPLSIPMQAVEQQIETLITSPVKLVADIAAHTMSAGGKRLRPALTLLAAQLCGDNALAPHERTLLCAAAVELMHTTALIHDDVVDSATVRRGKPAANLIWGNETSVLVGDYLFAQVFVTVAQTPYVDLLPAMAQATSQLCAGELLETQTRGMLSMPEGQYCDIIALKTAALTECACRLGALAMRADEEQTERLARFGREVGMAFQIVDDVFDIVSTQGRVGKPVGNDIREGDITLPMLRAMQVCSEDEKKTLIAIIGKDPINDAEVQTALEILRGCDAVEYSLKMAAGYVQSAKAQLAVFEAGVVRDMLSDIADYTLSRDK